MSQLHRVQTDLLQCNQKVNMVEAALLKLMRRNHDAGLVYTSQEGKDANYFQLFFYITAFYSLSLDAPNYNQNYHSSFAQLFSYFSYGAAKYLETLSNEVYSQIMSPER